MTFNVKIASGESSHIEISAVRGEWTSGRKCWASQSAVTTSSPAYRRERRHTDTHSWHNKESATVLTVVIVIFIRVQKSIFRKKDWLAVECFHSFLVESSCIYSAASPKEIFLWMMTRISPPGPVPRSLQRSPLGQLLTETTFAADSFSLGPRVESAWWDCPRRLCLSPSSHPGRSRPQSCLASSIAMTCLFW